MLDTLERLFYWFGSFLLEGDVQAHCQIRSAVDETTLVTTTDSLMTAIEILGSRKLVGPVEFEKQAAAVAAKLSAMMKSGNGLQHSFGLSFRSDPAGARRALEEIVRPSRATAQRLGVSPENLDYLDDQVSALVARCVEESVYLVVLTHGAGLSPSARKRSAEWRQEANARAAKLVEGRRVRDEFAQTPRIPDPQLFPRHDAMVKNLVAELKMDLENNGAGLLVRVLDCKRAANLMRRQFDAGDFDSTWSPRYIGESGAVAGLRAPRRGDDSTLLPPPIGRQMLGERIREKFDSDYEIAYRAGKFYSSVVMEVVPEDGSAPFSELTRRIGRQIPWALSFDVTPNGEKTRAMDQFYGGFVGGFGDHNKKVRSAWRELKRLAAANVYVGALRAVFTTWGETERECVDNVSFLKSALESWDSPVVSNETGSPALALLCTAAGFSNKSPAPYMPGPLSEIARMFPMYRPASVWSTGQLLTHTAEGRPYPVAFGSTEQAFWGTLGFAPGGSGKSFLLSMINYGILRSPGLEEVPYLVVIDVGPSSKLVMDLVRAELPEHLQRQVVSLRIRNDKEYTVNFLDTQHGCDEPTNMDLDFQIAVVTTVCPTLGPEGGKFVSQVIKEAYRMFSRKSPDQRLWQRSFDSALHDKLLSQGCVFDEKTRVWDVVDRLFDMGMIDDSAVAQRYAMPRMMDLVKAASRKTISDQWGTALATNGERMIDTFIRSITAAQDEYQLISGFTRFDVGSARAMSIDLEEVVGTMTSEEGRRRSGIMFLFARRLGARNFFLRWDDIQEMVPERYRAYQEARVQRIYESLKFLEYDEKHYTTGIESVDTQIAIDLRVGRKYKTVTMMFSQLLEDFPPAAVDNCYTYFVLGAGSNNSTARLRDTFGLSDSEVKAIEAECTGPGKLFALFKTKMGATSQVLHTSAGPFMQWAFNTDTDDALLRTEITRRMGYLEGLRALAAQFPKGSAREDIERYKRRRGAGDREHRSVTEVFADRVSTEVAKNALAEAHELEEAQAS